MSDREKDARDAAAMGKELAEDFENFRQAWFETASDRLTHPETYEAALRVFCALITSGYWSPASVTPEPPKGEEP